jgi:type IV fimbrial biogenesis protein FimT
MSVREKGFTLIELLITLVVAAILMLVAAPSFVSFINGSRADAQISSLVVSLQEARTHSLKERRSVTVCGGTVSPAAVPSCDGTWDNGWAVFVEKGTTIGSYQNGDLVISVHDPLSDSFNLSSSSASVSFDGRGWAASGSGTMKICDSSNDDNYARQVSIAASGRVSIQKSGVTCP